MKTKTKILYVLALGLLLQSGILQAQDDDKKKTMEIYGFIMMDAGYNFDQIHPDWFDVVSPSKLPAYKDEYGSDGNA